MRLESSLCYPHSDASWCVLVRLCQVSASGSAGRLRGFFAVCSRKRKKKAPPASLWSVHPLLLSTSSHSEKSRFLNRRCTSPTRSDSSTTRLSQSPSISPLRTLLRPSLCRHFNLFGEPHKRGGAGRRTEGKSGGLWCPPAPLSGSSFLETKECTRKSCKKSLYGYMWDFF